VFLDEDALRQRLLVVAGQDRHFCLQDHRAGIELRHDEMHRAAMLGDAGLKRLPMGMRALEQGQQRRVDIDHPPFPARHEPGRQDAHEACKDEQVDLVDPQHFIDRALEGFAISAEGAVIDGRGGDAEAARPLEPGDVGNVRDDERDLRRIARRLRRFRQRDHVGAAPGDQHPDALAGRGGAHSESLPR